MSNDNFHCPTLWKRQIWLIWQWKYQLANLVANRDWLIVTVYRLDDCLEGKRENYQVCSVQYCVRQLCTVQFTHIIIIIINQFLTRQMPVSQVLRRGTDLTVNSSLDWVLSHWAHFTVLRFICVLCSSHVHGCVHVYEICSDTGGRRSLLTRLEPVDWNRCIFCWTGSEGTIDISHDETDTIQYNIRLLWVDKTQLYTKIKCR